METNQLVPYKSNPAQAGAIFLTADFGDGEDLLSMTEWCINKGGLPEMIKVYTKDNMNEITGRAYNAMTISEIQ